MYTCNTYKYTYIYIYIYIYTYSLRKCPSKDVFQAQTEVRNQSGLPWISPVNLLRLVQTSSIHFDCAIQYH